MFWIYELDPTKFLSAPGLAWLSALKKTKILYILVLGLLDLLTDIDMLLMVEKCIREGICYSIYQYWKSNNKYTKNFDKKRKNLHIFNIGM